MPWSFPAASSGVQFSATHTRIAPLRMRASVGQLDAGTTLFEREASLRAKNMHKALGLDDMAWQLIADRVCTSSYDATKAACARLDLGFAGSEAVVHYTALAVGYAASAAATQPLSVTQSVQMIQIDGPIGFIESWKAVRANDKKTLWDGVVARFLHTFSWRVTLDAAKALLFNVFGIKNWADCFDKQDDLYGAVPTESTVAGARRVMRHIAGSTLLARTAALVADVTTSPLATVRIRLECQHALPDAAALHFDSTLHCFREIAQREGGWRAFFRGVDHLAYGYARDVAFFSIVAVFGYGIYHFATSPSADESLRHYMCSIVTTMAAQSRQSATPAVQQQRQYTLIE
jgi:Mitochondrial carrier protein